MNSYSKALSMDVIQDSTGGFKSLNVKLLFFVKALSFIFHAKPIIIWRVNLYKWSNLM